MTEEGFLDHLAQRLTSVEPARLVPMASAGVAVIFRGTGRHEEVLLIKRAVRDGDPWSGQVAFPGGMVNAADGSFKETAARETFEEVGIDLRSEAFLGYMGELKARMRQVVVVPSVFILAAAPRVTLNKEVSSCEWVPLRMLAGKEARSTYLLQREGEDVDFPSLVYQDFVIWGLTERILSAIVRAPTEHEDERVYGDVERY